MSASTITDGAHPRSGVSHGYSKTGGGVDGRYLVKSLPSAQQEMAWSSVNELRLVRTLRYATAPILKPALRADRPLQSRHSRLMGEAPPFIGWS